MEFYSLFKLLHIKVCHSITLYHHRLPSNLFCLPSNLDFTDQGLPVPRACSGVGARTRNRQDVLSSLSHPWRIFLV